MMIRGAAQAYPRVASVAAAAWLAFSPATVRADGEAPPPSDPITIALATGTETLHPFTTHRFPATSADEDDPVNLVFEGASDPREIRAALLSLSTGDRTAYGFPNAFPFNCIWSDGGGDEQATWTERAGWQPGAVQLACGPYAMRFHLRLFRHDGRTLGGVHMDLQIPGTTIHQVLSWNLPQQIVLVDMIRSGLLGSQPYFTEAFGPTPSHRAIPHYVHNALPPGLRVALGLPPGEVGAGEQVPIPCSGRAAVFSVLPSFVAAQSDTRTEFDIVFDMGIPKPFCNDGNDWVRVQGPVHFTQRIQINPSGRYARTDLVSGLLSVTPFDPLTGEPTGPTVRSEEAGR